MIAHSQRELLGMIRDRRTTNNTSPTMAELATVLGVTKQAVCERLKKLESRGLVRRQWHTPRSLMITDDGLALCQGHEFTSTNGRTAMTANDASGVCGFNAAMSEARNAFEAGKKTAAKSASPKPGLVRLEQPRTVQSPAVYAPQSVEEMALILSREAAVGNGVGLVHVSIDAQLAGEILAKCNDGNRPKREHNIARYSSAMKDKRWGHSTLIFGVLSDSQLRLGDGQNRFTAQVDYDETIRYAIWAYSNSQEFERAVEVVDAPGSARTLRDILTILGRFKNSEAQYAEAVANWMVKFDGTRPSHGLAQDQRVNYVTKWSKSIAFVVRELTARKFKPHVLAGLAYAFSKEPNKTREFARIIDSNDGLVKGYAAHTMSLLLPDLNAARSEKDKRRATAITIRLASDFAHSQRTKTRVDVMCEPTKAAVERCAGKTAWKLIEDKAARTPAKIKSEE